MSDICIRHLYKQFQMNNHIAYNHPSITVRTDVAPINFQMDIQIFTLNLET